jgi:plastocyanin
MPRDSLTTSPWRALAVALPLTLPAFLLARPDRLHSAARAGVQGRVEGRIRVGRALDVRRARFRVYSDAGAAAVPPRDAEASALEGVVVYLEGVPRGSATTTPARMEQRDERFVPRVLPILAGTTVSFPNADPIFHNVFSLSGAKAFDLGRFPRGEAKSVRFDKPGVVQVFCHIHSDMRAVVLVLDTPAFAVPGADGRYALAGLPPGEYTLVAWHERAQPIRRKVHVTAGGTVVEDVDIPILDDQERAAGASGRD